MNTKAIEWIKGYCCEVTQEQWEELVKVADEVGLPVNAACEHRYAQLDGHKDDDYCLVCLSGKFGEKEIPFPDFLAKLRGDEEWTPKAGEMVECRDGVGSEWFLAKYVGHDGKWAVCRPEHHPLGHYTVHNDVNFRQALTTITREEAEKQLGKRIID